ncbi:MAG: CheR family methyltransferase [Thermoanaerobaculia bacterium]
MRDADCVAFLRWALPRLDLRWRGFRRPRRQVCRRVERRFRALGLPHVAAYRDRLLEDPAEWERLAPLCRVTISRFFRDRMLFESLGEEVLPELARSPGAAGRGELSIWSAGCGAGEEPYSLAILARLSPSRLGPRLRIQGTDVDPRQLERARQAVYPESSLRDVPPAWREAAFSAAGEGRWLLDPTYRRGVELTLQDLRLEAPAGPFHLVLCRNLAFTYFAESLQREALHRIRTRLAPGGALVVGGHETLPADSTGFEPWRPAVWRLLA